MQNEVSVRDEAIEEVVRSVYLKAGGINRNDVDLVWSLIEAAMLSRGWKMTPRDASPGMIISSNECAWSSPDIWEVMWGSAPSPGDDP